MAEYKCPSCEGPTSYLVCCTSKKIRHIFDKRHGAAEALPCFQCAVAASPGSSHALYMGVLAHIVSAKKLNKS